MNYLKSRKLGRATFLPLNKMQANRPSGKAAMSVNKPGVLGFAHELLDYDPRIATAVAYALRNTLVVCSYGGFVFFFPLLCFNTF